MFSKKYGPGLKEIARQAGLAVPTVSLILNGRSNNYISDKTRERVQTLARELGYQPRFTSRLLSRQQTRTVAVVLPGHLQNLDPHLKELALDLIARFEAIDHAAYVATLSTDPCAQVLHLADRGCEAFVFIGMVPEPGPLVALLVERDLNFIGYNSNLGRGVLSDTPSGVAQLLRFFISQGRSDFFMFLLASAELYGPNSRGAALPLVFPYGDPLPFEGGRGAFLPEGPGDGASRFEAGYRAAKEFLSTGKRAGAFFFHSDHHALGGVRAFTEGGLLVGRDILVAGYNHHEAVRFGPLPISSAGPDLSRIAPLLVADLFSEGPVTHKVAPEVFLQVSETLEIKGPE